MLKIVFLALMALGLPVAISMRKTRQGPVLAFRSGVGL